LEDVMTHIREHRSVLAAAEQQLLMAIARRLPPWISSDQLTLLGLVSMPAAGLAFAHIAGSAPNVTWFALALAANWFGDSLDGTLARVRQCPRPNYGYYVDHVIDLAGTAALIAGMGASGLVHPSIAVAMLAAYLLVSAETYLATNAVGVFRISFAGIGPTELRIALAAGAGYVSMHPWVDLFGRRVLLLDVSALVATIALVTVFIVSAIRNARILYRAEPLRCPAASARAARRLPVCP
jgi:phosphatidylglycerophosphate synthase